MRASRCLSESILEDDVLHPFGSSLLLCIFALFYFDISFFHLKFRIISVVFRELEFVKPINSHPDLSNW